MFLGEVGRRREMREQTVAALKTELEQLEREDGEERKAEAQAFRLASRSKVSEVVFQEELGVIQNRRRAIAERSRRVLAQLEGLNEGFPTPEAMKALQQRLGSVLDSEVADDRGFVLDALGVSVIAHGDGSWDLELEVPQEAAPTGNDMRIETTGPRSSVHYLHRGFTVRIPGARLKE